jgi:Flp pilus assembly protein TadG
MRFHGLQSKSRGQGIVEFALVIPIVFALIFGVLELGWLLYNNHTLSNSTREGARYAMVNGDRSENTNAVSEVEAIVSEYASGLSGPVSTTVSPNPIGEPGTEVTVSTTFQYEPIVGMIIGTGSIELSSESTVIVQY